MGFALVSTRLYDAFGAPIGSVAGALKVIIIGGAGSGGTSSVDQAPFTAGVTAGTPIMVYDATSGEVVIAASTPGTRKLAVDAAVTVTPVTSSTVSAVAITTVGTGSTTLLALNNARKRFLLQNVGTTKIYILFGAGAASSSNYHLVLAAGGTTADGSGLIYPDTMWLGAIQASSSAAGGSMSSAEFS